ncbi:MAG: SH3 domain-containing protein [Anaerolineaceae bacterium]|nr:SH3 domain-containing protein [Anaerolineaceae bacterium]
MLARMTRSAPRRLWLLPVVLFLAAACSALEPQAAPPTVTLLPRSTATPLPSETPAPTATQTPGATFTLAPSKTPPPSPTPARSGLIDAVRSVNLRSGPGVSYGALAALQPGERVILLAQDEDASWQQVQLADGRVGWVAASLIVEAEEPTSELPVIDVESVRATATAIAASDAAVAEPAAPAAEGPGETAGGGALRTGVDVLAYCDDADHGFPPPEGLVAGSTIDVWWTWFASTRAQVEDHLAHAIYEVTVDGEPLNDWRDYRLPPERHDDGNTYVYWYVRYGPLEAGDHRITYQLTWSEAISDGYRRFGPGTDTTQESGSCSFRVLPAGG